MSAADVLQRLEGVRETGRSTWIARCPSHPDRRPSLAIRELEDSRLLLHCFAGCDVQAVLQAIGLELDALFPRRTSERNHRERRPFAARDALACLSFETMVVAVAAGNMARGERLTDEDRARLLQAATRLQHAAEVNL